MMYVLALCKVRQPVDSSYGSEEALSRTMGVMVALVSFLEADKNAIRSIHAGELPGGWVLEGLPWPGSIQSRFWTPRASEGWGVLCGGGQSFTHWA